MNINKAKVGFFTAKIPFGEYFADKNRDDFETEEEYNEYLDSITDDSWIKLKEATVEQTVRLQELSLNADDALLAKMDGPTLLKYYEQKSQAELKAIKIIAEIVTNNIVDHNFTLDDEGTKKAKNEEVGNLISSNAPLLMSIFTRWQEQLGKSRRKKPETLDIALK